MKEIQINQSLERQAYLPADITVIEIAAADVICQSGGAVFDEYENGGTY